MALDLKPSVFNTVLPTADESEFVVYNTLYRTVAAIPAESLPVLGWHLDTAEQVCRGRMPAPLKSLRPGGPGQTLSPREPEITARNAFVDHLTSLKFLVPEDEDEYANLDGYLSRGYTPKVFYPVVAFTAACNLDCVYCFEEGTVDRRAKMSPSLAERTVRWIEDYVDGHDLERIALGLFGGEPLLYLQAANYFIDEVSKIAERRGLPFEFGITTNGTRLSRGLVEDWVARGLREVRITLDGPPDIHDSRRFYRSKQKKGSFDDILSRLVSIADIDGFNITIEINIDLQNFAHVGDLLDILEEAGLRKRVLIAPEQTLETLASSGESGCSGCSKGCSSGSRFDPAWFSNVLAKSRLADAFVEVVDAISRRGFRMPEMVGVYYPCIFVQRHHVVIDWHGDMYKCSFTIGNEEMAVGDVDTGFNWRNEDMLSSVKVIDWCKERKCAYIPICGGGCRYEAFNKTGSYHVPNCKAELIDFVLPRTLPYAFGLKPIRRAPRQETTSAEPLGRRTEEAHASEA